MKALLLAGLCATAAAQDILVYGTMPNPYQILKWDTWTGQISPIGTSKPGYLASPELSAIDYQNMVYYNLIYNVNTSSIQLYGTSLATGAAFAQMTLPFTSGAHLGHGESVCVDHSTGTVYVAGPMSSDLTSLTWLAVNAKAGTYQRVGAEQGVNTRVWWGSSSTFDFRRRTIWTIVQYNTSGKIEFDMVSINVTNNATSKAPVPMNRWCMSLSYDTFSDKIYCSAIQINSGVVTHVIASFSPSLSFDNWRQANTTGFQPYSMIVAFAHHGNAPPVLFSLALPIGVKPSPTAGPWYIAGFEADTGAFINEQYACRNLMTCPISIEVTEPFGPRQTLAAGKTAGKKAVGAEERK